METSDVSVIAEVQSSYKSSYEEWKRMLRMLLIIHGAGYKSSYEEWKHVGRGTCITEFQRYKSSYEEWKRNPERGGRACH